MRAGLLSFFGCVSLLRALDPATAISQYQKDTWQVEAGLPQNFVNAIVERPDGYLLVGTGEGLVRFDGLRFRDLGAQVQAVLAHQWITDLYNARDGSLWIGTYTGGPWRLRDGRLESFEAIDGHGVRDMHEDADGNLWILTLAGGFRYRDGKVERAAALGGAGAYRWCLFAEQRDHTLWAVSGRGLTYRRGGAWNRLLPETSEYGEVMSVYVTRDDRVWLGTSRGLYRRESATSWERIPGIEGPISSILEDRDGLIWAGTWGDGLYRWDHRAAVHWSMRDGLSDNFVRTLYEDRHGDVWIGTRSGGLTRWKDGVAVPVGIAEGMDGPYASTGGQGPDGSVWLGTWRSGLYRHREGKLSAAATPEPLRRMIVRSLAVGRDGAVWIGTWDALYAWRSGAWSRTPRGRSAPCPRPAALAVARDGALWCGSDGDGIQRWAHTRPDFEGRTDYVPGAVVTTLLESHDGVMWAGTSLGLARMKGTTTSFFVSGKDLPPGPVTALFEDAHGRMWVAQRGGVLSVREAAGFRTFNAANGLPDGTLLALVADDRGGIWASSAHGVFRADASSLEALAEGRASRIAWEPFDRSDGLRTIECNGWSQPAAWKDRAGHVWFPTGAGFIEILPERLKETPIPAVRLERIAVGGREVVAGDGLRLAPRSRDLDVEFNVPHLRAPEKLRFRYRLDGFESGWHETSSRQIRFASLPAGRYTLQMAVGLAGRPWSEPAALLRFEQAPEFRETRWFPISLLAAGSVLAGALYSYVLRGQRLRRAAVESERQRIAREWHDTLLADFAAISWQLQATGKALPEGAERAGQSLDLARSMVRHSQTEARRIIWDMHDAEEEGKPLRDSLQQMVESATAAVGIPSSFHCATDEPAITLGRRRHLLRIGQEAVANAIQHAQPSRVNVELEFGRESVSLVVADDGQGFDVAAGRKATGHFGLAGMSERAALIGGELKIRSAPNAGTRVEVVAPLHEKS